jgi:[ribosomal protein S18]-alanine N-acetyltransferase
MNTSPPPIVEIRPLASDGEAEACARLMATTEPWITLKRSYVASLAILQDPTREVYVACGANGLAGFLVLCLVGPFTGYIQTICVHPEQRGNGLGTQFVAFAEARITTVSPNVFLCVSSFNPRAQALYERLGYAYVGQLSDYLVRGHSELLYRKSLGPWAEFVPRSAP